MWKVDPESVFWLNLSSQKNDARVNKIKKTAAEATVFRVRNCVQNLPESQSGQVRPDGFNTFTRQPEAADRLGVEWDLDALVRPNAEVHDRGDLFLRRATLDGQT